LNLRPSGYEPDELPDCSTPHQADHHNGRRYFLQACNQIFVIAAYRCNKTGGVPGDFVALVQAAILMRIQIFSSLFCDERCNRFGPAKKPVADFNAGPCRA
jgi:hypothetical protein